MFETLENGIGLDIVRTLQANGSPLLDALAKLLDVIGGDLGFLLLLPILYWSVNRRLGRQLLLVLVVALVGTLSMKLLLARPRPYVLHPDVITPLFTENSYGIPSGHVILSLTLWGFIAAQVKRGWVWGIVAFWVLLVGWSRMYAGVHYPQDVVGALIWGGVLLGASLALLQPVARWWTQAPLWGRLAVILAAGVGTALLFHQDMNGLSTAGVIFGGGLGLILEERLLRFSSAGGRTQRIVRTAVGLVLLVVVFFALRAAFAALMPIEVWRVLRYALVTLMTIFVLPWCAAAVGWMTAERPTVVQRSV